MSFLLDIFRPEYEPPAALHALMLTVAGAAFGSQLIKKDGG